MHFDAESEINKIHLAENDQPMHHVSNTFLLGSYIKSTIDLYVQWVDAAASGNIVEIRRLIHLGANVGWKDAKKMNALHFSAKSGHKEVAELLLNQGAAVDAKTKHSSTALHLAAVKGHEEVVNLLLHHHATVDARDDSLNTALHIAADRGHTEIVQLLLHSSASVDAKDNYSYTSLHYASRMGRKEVVALLLDYGAAVDARNYFSATPLHEAAKKGHTEIVQMLLNSSASVDAKNNHSCTSFHLAAMMGHKEVVGLLLDYGAAVDARDRFWVTPLHKAAENGHKNIVQMLLNSSASVDAKDENSNNSDTLLHLAASKGHKEVVNLLLDNGAAVDARNHFSATALHKAAENGHTEIVQLLLNTSASVDAKDNRSYTSLHLAARMGRKEVVGLLLDYGAAVDARNSFLATPLHKAAENGHTEIVQMLLNHDASVDSKDEDSNTALHYASENRHKELVALLLDYGAAVDARNRFSATVLHKAAKLGHTEIVQLLLNSSADVDAKNDNSETALHLAVSLRHKQVVKLLLGHGASADLKDDNSNTPIQLAAKTRDKYIISQLIASGLNINEKFKDGKTLLAELSKAGDIEMATLLLDLGADKEAIDVNGQTPLIIAASAAEQSMVSLLIEKGSHIDACDNDLLTALHWSAKDGHFSILELLLQKNANTESKSKDGNTALHIAVEYNRTNIVAALIDHKANVNAKNGDGKSTIEVAISNGHIDMIYQLKDAGASIGDNGDEKLWLLYLAAEVGQVSLIESTLDKVDEEERKNYMNATLHEASRHGQVNVVTYLLDNGAEIESLNDDGLTPLFLAGQCSDVISTLIHRGAYINARSKRPPHYGILHHYASLDQTEGVRLLLNYDYNIDTRDDFDQTALHYVARERKGDCEVAGILLQQGVDVNAKDRDGRTALHHCSGHDSLDLANLLIGFGIYIDETTFWTRSTALHFAIKCGNLKLISLLVRHRADVNARNDRETALHMAARKNLTAECALLIEAGANVNSRNGRGDTPLATALHNYNPTLVKLLLEHGASVDAFGRSKIMEPNIISGLLGREENYNLFRRCLDVVNLFVKAGADCSGMEEAMAKMEKKSPTMRKLLTDPSYQQLKLKDNMRPSSSIIHEREKEYPDLNDFYSEDESETEEGDDARIPLKELTSNDINVYEVDPHSGKLLVDTKNKYGGGFPRFKRLHLDKDEVVGNQEDNSIAIETAVSAQPLKLFGAISMDERVMNIVQSLLNCVGARFFASDHYFMLELNTCVDVMPPKWASHFDKMKGVIRETGRLIVQVPSKRSSLSIPAWQKSSNPYLRFIDTVYTCRRSCLRLSQEAFSDVLGGSEQKLAADLHAILIAGLSILSIAGGNDHAEELVMAIRGVKLTPIQNVLPPNSMRNDWQVRNLRHCPCGTDSIHSPLSPVAAAKAVGIDIWRERSENMVNRVWDLQDDILVEYIDVREVVFITHKWDSPEINYQTVMEMKKCNSYAISLMSAKLCRIRNALKKDTRYVWIDTLCIDKANLSELDEAIRSMYKWYASCAAVVLDSGTPLDTWRSRGWCLQEGAAAGLLYGISNDGSLATVQQLALEQKQNLCTLDLHLYYRPGNAVEILTRMDVRKTTRKEDMAYALAGIFSINLTLAYGEGLQSRTRLLEQLAIQKGDLSFLSFHTTQRMLHNSLPAIGETHYLIAKCTTASAPVIVSHFGICFEVQLVKGEDARRLLQKLKVWSEFRFAKGRFSGVEELIKAGEQFENQNSLSVEIAVVHDIRSLILVQVYGYDMQTGGGKPIKLCYRLQCCQIEENEFDRLLTWNADKPKKSATLSAKAKAEEGGKILVKHEDDTKDKDNGRFERIWLGDKTDSAELNSFESRTTGHHMRNRQRIL